MRVSQFLVLGLSEGCVGVVCEKHLCEFQVIVPPHSTLLDIERATKFHTHPVRT